MYAFNKIQILRAMKIIDKLKKEHEIDLEKGKRGEKVEDVLIARYRGYALNAVEFAYHFYEIKLDFSEESIEYVEEILNKLSVTIEEVNPTEEQKKDITRFFAGYIGEVIRNKWGGNYIKEDEGPIKNNGVSLKVNSHYYYLLTKVYKRLTQGEKDNLLLYYQKIKQDIETNQ